MKIQTHHNDVPQIVNSVYEVYIISCASIGRHKEYTHVFLTVIQVWLHRNFWTCVPNVAYHPHVMCLSAILHPQVEGMVVASRTPNSHTSGYFFKDTSRRFHRFQCRQNRARPADVPSSHYAFVVLRVNRTGPVSQRRDKRQKVQAKREVAALRTLIPAIRFFFVYNPNQVLLVACTRKNRVLVGFPAGNKARVWWFSLLLTTKRPSQQRTDPIIKYNTSILVLSRPLLSQHEQRAHQWVTLLLCWMTPVPSSRASTTWFILTQSHRHQITLFTPFWDKLECSAVYVTIKPIREYLWAI